MVHGNTGITLHDTIVRQSVSVQITETRGIDIFVLGGVKLTLPLAISKTTLGFIGIDDMLQYGVSENVYTVSRYGIAIARTQANPTVSGIVLDNGYGMVKAATVDGIVFNACFDTTVKYTTVHTSILHKKLQVIHIQGIEFVFDGDYTTLHQTGNTSECAAVFGRDALERYDITYNLDTRTIGIGQCESSYLFVVSTTYVTIILLVVLYVWIIEYHKYDAIAIQLYGYYTSFSTTCVLFACESISTSGILWIDVSTYICITIWLLCLCGMFLLCCSRSSVIRRHLFELTILLLLWFISCGVQNHTAQMLYLLLTTSLLCYKYTILFVRFNTDIIPLYSVCIYIMQLVVLILAELCFSKFASILFGYKLALFPVAPLMIIFFIITPVLFLKE